MGAGANVVLDKGFRVEGTEELKAYTCVELGAEAGLQSVRKVQGKGNFVIGVLQEDVPKKMLEKAHGNLVANVRILGITYCIAAGALNAGARVAAQADGRVNTAAGSESVVGVALEKATNENDLVKVLLTPGEKEA